MVIVGIQRQTIVYVTMWTHLRMIFFSVRQQIVLAVFLPPALIYVMTLMGTIT